MIRLQIIIAILIVTHGLTGYFAYNYAKGKQAIVENKIIEKQIENDNEDKKAIAESQKRIDTTRIIYRDRLIKIPDIRVSDAADSGCSNLLDVSTELRNETYRAFPEMYFSSADSLPSSNK